MMRRLLSAVLALLVLAPAPAAAATSAPPAYLDKLDSHIQERAAVAPSGRQLVDVYVNGDIDAAAQHLRELGMQVTAISRQAPERMVEGLLPLEAADVVAALGSTHAVLSIGGGAGTDTGSVLSQGDAALRGPQARALGATGAGVTVGVMSDSINKVGGGIAESQLSGNLPSNVTDLGDSATGTDEGRAMAEIIYDEAPGITHMVFDTGGGGGATKASHILALAGAGARVIADDTYKLEEPFFQDGVVSQAVDQVKSEGVAYIASAGNRARQSWEGTFTPGAGANNDFGGGDTEQTVTSVPPGDSIYIVLQWNEPWGHATTNLDFYLRDLSSGNSVVSSGTTENIGGYPVEHVEWTNPNASTHTVAVEIHRTAGSGAPLMKYIANGNFGPFGISEHATGSPAINPDAAAANGALAAAAVCWSQTTGPCSTPGLQTPETFSSRGPLVRTRDAGGALLSSPETRQKPNLAGVDGVATSVPGFGSFFGTSAAAPSIAGIAALALSARPSLSVDQLYAILTDPAAALDCTSAAGNPDTDCGAGFSQADKVVTEAQDTSPPVVTPAVSPEGPYRAGSWYHSPVGVGWSVSDPESVVLSRSSGCGPTTVSTPGVTELSCSATSIGGSTTGTAKIKLDLTPPSAPRFAGIAAKAYAPSLLPANAKVTCTAGDPESGIASCTVSGYSRRPGAHNLTAVATDNAGLSSTSTLHYRVSAVASNLKLGKATLGTVVSSGLPISLEVAGPRTKLSVTVSTATGGKTVLGKLTKKVGAGKAKLRVQLSAKGKRALRGLTQAEVAVKVTATSAGVKTSLGRKLTLKR